MLALQVRPPRWICSNPLPGPGLGRRLGTKGVARERTKSLAVSGEGQTESTARDAGLCRGSLIRWDWGRGGGGVSAGLERKYHLLIPNPQQIDLHRETELNLRNVLHNERQYSSILLTCNHIYCFSLIQLHPSSSNEIHYFPFWQS